jgi:hypothetical protein
MTDYINLRGKTKYFRPWMMSQYNKFEHVLYPIPEDVEVIRELQAKGLKNILRKDDEGYNINIARSPEIKIRGMSKALPPVVVTYQGQPYTGNVGDGSDVTTTVEVYSHGVPGVPGKKSVAWRWHSTRIDNLVPFKPKDLLPNEKEAIDHADKTEHAW